MPPIPGPPRPMLPPGAPTPAPAATPAPALGQQAQAKLRVGVAMKVLEQALATFGSATDEGKAILTALKGLSGAFGAASGSPGLEQSEVQTLGSAMGGGPAGGAGGPGGAMTPQMLQALRAKIQSQVGRLPAPPGAAPVAA